MTDAIADVAGKGCTWILTPIWEAITVVYKYKKNVEDRENKLNDLTTRKKTVQVRIDEGLQFGGEIIPEVTKWMDDANKYPDGKEEKSGEELEAANKCCFQWCPKHPLSRYRVSGKAEKDVSVVAELLQKADRFDKVYYFPAQKQKVPATVKDFENFYSRKSVLDKIMEALKSPSINIIGVYGMPGVGKTMLVREIQSKVQQEMFDSVVMASVTRNPELKRIQEEIARDLNLKFLNGTSSLEAADIINRKLMKKNKVLVIFDDIWAWGRDDIEKIGIPFRKEQKHPGDKNKENDIAIPFVNEHKHPRDKAEENSPVEVQCKILCTSRYVDVLRGDMNAEEIIEVEQLQYPDALELFKKIVGKNFVESLADQVVRQCQGLPLAISVFGGVLKTRTGHREWSAAIEQLRTPTPENSGELYSAIKLSFEQLRGDGVQDTFLLCNLLGHDASIEDLLKYVVGLDLYGGSLSPIEAARERAISLINDLKRSSLLCGGGNIMHFDVHDIVRDVSISIASRDHGVFVLRDKGTLKGFPHTEEMGKLRWIYLSSCADISLLLDELDQQSEFPQLTFFHLSSKDHSSSELPANFFWRMEKLKVLDLAKIKLSPIPLSISLLTTLCTLRLDQCVLGIRDIAVIGELKNLRVLSLARCEIEELPKEIEKLTKLKMLDLTDCAKLKVIPPGVIASLSRLEELKMGNSFDKWEVKREENQENASLSELSLLQNLTALEVRICDAQMIPTNFFFKNLERYKIFIGDVENNRNRPSESTKILKLRNVSTHSVKMLLNITEELHLEEFNGDGDLVNELGDEGFEKLKYLYVSNAENVQQIINSGVRAHLNAFPSLEILSLHKMIKLQKIFQGRFNEKPFIQLRIIEVEYCDQLKNLFSLSIARQLLQLQKITVTNCRNIAEIVDVEEQGNKTDNAEAEKVEFDSLRCLRLHELPELISFCHERNVATSSRGIPLFNEKVPKIEELQLFCINVNIIWHTSMEPSRVENLTKLIVEGCNKLQYLFSSSVARRLGELRYLKIRECKLLREIILAEHDEEEDLIFRELNFLHIEDLQNLVSFYSGSCFIELQSLKELSIENCPELKGFTDNTDVATGIQHLFNEQVAFPVLESMSISHLKFLKIIWHNHLSADSFCKLKSLKVAFCENLLTIFPSNNMLGRFCPLLEELSINGCGSLQVVFELEEFNFRGSQAAIDTKLRILKIWNLPNLMYVWNKDPEGILGFQNLESVLAYGCRSLKNMFPASVARRLRKLQRLRVESCGVEEIVAMEGRGTQALVSFEFPEVSCLVLRNLLRLRYFYPENHTTEWPKLKKFYFKHEGGVKNTDRQGRLEFPVQQPLFYVQEVIPQLEKLSLTRDDIAMISKGQFKQDLFYNIKVLWIQNYYDDESAVLPLAFLNQFRHLQKLVVNDCYFEMLPPSEKLEDIIFQPFSNRAVEVQRKAVEDQKKAIDVLSRIRRLKLHKLQNLKHIWSRDILENLEMLKVWQCDSLISLSASAVSCSYLTTLDVWNCQQMENLFSVPTALSLEQLTRMTVRQCHKLTKIIESEGDGIEKSIIFFSKLRKLELECLTGLEHFYIGKSICKFPSLEQVIVNQCPKLKLFCEIPPNTPVLQRVQLIRGEDKWCRVDDLNTTIREMYTKKVGYAGLESLRLTEFPELLKMWDTASPQEILKYFRCLQSLEICGCSKLGYLLTHSMAQHLGQLVQLKVINCSEVEHVIMGDEVEKEMRFPLLQSIFLESCTNLKNFYAGSCTFRCPSLVTIKVSSCPEMVAFASTSYGEQEGAPQYFFNKKVDFANLEILNLSSINIQQIWHKRDSELPSFVQNLRKLTVDRCDNLKFLFTSSMVKNFEQLNGLEIRSCPMMEWVIVTEKLAQKEMGNLCLTTLDTLLLEELPKLTGFSDLAKLQKSHCPEIENAYTPSLFDEKVSFPRLDRLTIASIGSMNKIWHEELNGDSFCQLNYLFVGSCKQILHIFPFSMQQRLQKLDSLLVHNCHSLQWILEPQGLSASQSQAAAQPILVEATTKFVFSNLTRMKLCMLPNLEGFCHQVHTIEFSSLRKLEVNGCCKVQIFASKFQSSQRITGDNQLEIQIPCPLFGVDKDTFPNLEELRFDGQKNLEQLKLNSNDVMKEIWHGRYSREYFPKLKVLELFHFPFPKQSAVLCSFLQSLPNLENLVLCEASFDEIFHNEGLGDEEKPTQFLSKLLRLSLRKEESQGIPLLLNNLECSKLKNSVPSIGYFENLQILKVSTCHGFKNLMRHSVAKSLVQLKRMSISHCAMIKEIVVCVGGEMKDGITFSQLKSLQLHELPELSSFCLAKCNFVFPSLEEVIVTECPQMQIFSRGKLFTPELQKVSIGVKSFWKGNLNSTIRSIPDELSPKEVSIPWHLIILFLLSFFLKFFFLKLFSKYPGFIPTTFVKQVFGKGTLSYPN